jgi:hypothetical protein
MLASLHELCLIAMSDKPDASVPEPRKYEESGCYPENGKPYRIWALLGGLMLVIVLLAGAAIVLNLLLLPEA